MPRRGRSRRTRALTAAGITTAVLAAGGGGVAYATSRSPAPTFVTASAGAHSVVQTLQATGTTQPSSAATVSFAVSGTVATVPVAMGDRVTAGQVLATLDTTSLKFAVATAQGQVANANLTLAQAESGQVSTASGSGGGTGTAASRTGTATGSTGTSSSTATSSTTISSASTSSKSGSTSGTAKSPGSSRSGAGPTVSIATAQRLLLATVRRVDSSLAKTRTDLASATTLCATQTNPTPTPTTSEPAPAPASAAPAPTSSHTTPTHTPSDTTPTTVAPAAYLAASPTGSTTCIQAQQLVLRDESTLLLLQQGLSVQETSLDKLLTTAASSAAASSTGGTSSAGTSKAGTSTAGTSRGTAPAAASTSGKAAGSTTASGSSTVAVSAAQLAADQAAVDAAKANLVVAQQQLSQATIVSPINGVVSLVGLTVGQPASAGSATTAVDVIDQSGHSVTLSVDVSKIPQVKVGQKATVVPDGSATPLAATVSYVAAAPTTSGSTAYNVELAFSANPTKLQDGIQAAVTITTAAAANSLAVPTSAVNHRGTLSYVLVLNGSTTKAQIITIGAVGDTYTQVTQGLTTGQRVVLANPNQPIPTNTITGRVARITGGATNTTGVLGGTAGTSGARPGG